MPDEEQLCNGGKKGSVSVSRLGLFCELFKLFHNIEGIRACMKATLVFDQLPNIYMFLILSLNLCRVDIVFNMHGPARKALLLLPTREATALLVSAGFVLPMVMMHGWDIVNTNFDI